MMWFLKKRFFELLRRDGIPTRWEARYCLDILNRNGADTNSRAYMEMYAAGGDIEIAAIQSQRTKERVRQMLNKGCRKAWSVLRYGN